MESAVIETPGTSEAAPIEASVEADEAQLEEGFADAQVSTEPAQAAALPEAAEAELTPEPVYAKVTDAELRRLLASVETVDKLSASQDKAFGHIGSLQQKIDNLKAATPSGQPVKLSKEDFAELSAEFPEFAELTLKGLERALSKVSGTAPAAIDESKVDERVTKALITFRTAEARKEMEEDYPGWEAITGTKDEKTPYRLWLAAQPAEYQRAVSMSMRPSTLGKSIEKFKSETASRTPAPKLNHAADARRQQIAAAVTPRGSGGTGSAKTMSEDDELEAGFRA